MKRFSKEELFKLRNHIPINVLISEILNIPTTFSEGNLRFLCPLCKEFNTGIQFKTNLARCFRCEQRFNTIEMVMIYKQQGFLPSVQFLQGYLDNFYKNDRAQTHQKESTLNSTPNLVPPKQIRKQPVIIGEVIKNMCINRSEAHRGLDHPIPSPEFNMSSRLSELEKNFSRILSQFDQLKSFVISEFIEKSKKMG
jgi:hypothetical protein